MSSQTQIGLPIVPLTGPLSLWVIVSLACLLYGVVSLPPFSAADQPPSDKPRRNRTLDGLRGMAAFAVLVSHWTLLRVYCETGHWDANVPTVYRNLGPVGVSLFFLTTGFLFWDKALGRAGRLAWMQFFIGRVFRIAPVYLCMLAVALVLTFAQAGFTLRQAPMHVMLQVASCFTLGAYVRWIVNGFPIWLLIFNVVWSLQWEWGFYVALPVLSPLARARRQLLWLTIGLVVTFALARAFHQWQWHLCSLFGAGMLCATLHRRILFRISDRLGSVLVVVLLVTALSVRSTYGGLQVIAEAGAFYLAGGGVSLFGFLTSRPARRAGDISYGIYLFQGLPFTPVLLHASFRSAILGSNLVYWLTLLSGSFVAIAAATIAHKLVERPGIALGHRIGLAFEVLGRAGGLSRQAG